MRKDHKFSKSEAIKFGWGIVKRELRFFFGLAVVLILVNFILNVLAKDAKNLFFLFSFAFSILVFLVGLILQLGLIKISLNFVDNKKSQIIDLFTTHRPVFKFFAASILYGIVVFTGIILLIVPGIIWAIKFQFFSFLIVDKEIGPMEALKKSSQITTGAKWNLFVFGITLIWINILGALLLGIGLLITIPMTMVAQAYVYRKLLSQAPAR